MARPVRSFPRAASDAVLLSRVFQEVELEKRVPISHEVAAAGWHAAHRQPPPHPRLPDHYTRRRGRQLRGARPAGSAVLRDVRPRERASHLRVELRQLPQGRGVRVLLRRHGRQLLQRRRRVVAPPASQGAAHHERLAAARLHGEALLPRQGRDGSPPVADPHGGQKRPVRPAGRVHEVFLRHDHHAGLWRGNGPLVRRHAAHGRSDAMDTVMEVGFFRHTLPVSYWRLMKRLNIGPERKLAAAQLVLRRFVAEMMETRKNKGGSRAPPVEVDDITSTTWATRSTWTRAGSPGSCCTRHSSPSCSRDATRSAPRCRGSCTISSSTRASRTPSAASWRPSSPPDPEPPPPVTW
ncbi:hypothetical protein PR202_ga20120 [Eleusine coracana subsp. coracana]|uniref:Uncharacterized protein n=1 Tax=Eleusine coracana subsp. coracana TaxID=191504 RepID=A0AAV5CWJ3_ELECO|nr:hypothetical protein PR202_ga20120 [Eleusine coracana subsp. coracana]